MPPAARRWPALLPHGWRSPKVVWNAPLLESLLPVQHRNLFNLQGWLGDAAVAGRDRQFKRSAWRAGLLSRPSAVWGITGLASFCPHMLEIGLRDAYDHRHISHWIILRIKENGSLRLISDSHRTNRMFKEPPRIDSVGLTLVTMHWT